MIGEIIYRLDADVCKVHPIFPACREQPLRSRLQKDIDTDVRESDIIGRSTERIPLSNKLNTIKVDISDITPEQAADFIFQSTGMRK